MHYTTRRLLSITAIIALVLGVFGPKLFSQDFSEFCAAAWPPIANPLLWLFNQETYEIGPPSQHAGKFFGQALGFITSLLLHIVLAAVFAFVIYIVWDLGALPPAKEATETTESTEDTEKRNP